MTILITVDEGDLAGMQIQDDVTHESLSWEDIDRGMQIKMLNALASYHGLFIKFIKP